MTFTEIFSHAWQVFRQTRTIWFLGMLAALFGQSEYGVSANVNQNFDTSSSGALPTIDPYMSELIEGIIANPAPYITGLIGFAVVMVLISLLLGPITLGALIHATGEADRGAPVSFRASLGQGLARFLPVFLTGLLIAIPGLLVLIIVLAILIPIIGSILSGGGTPDPAVIVPTMIGGLLCLLPLILVVSIINLVLYFMRQLGMRSSVLEGAGAIDGLRFGWGLFRRNLAQVLLVWFILAAGGVVFGLIMAAPAFALLLIFTRGLMTSGLSADSLRLLGGVALYSILAGIVFGGALTGFSATVWTVLYRSLRMREQEARLMVGNPTAV